MYKFSKHSTNYRTRKILLIISILLLLIILGLLIFQVFYFLETIEIDKEEFQPYIKDVRWKPGVVTEEQKWAQISPAYAEYNLFFFLNSSAIASTVISIVLMSIVLVLLLKNKYNGDKFYPWIFTFVTLLFIFIFFENSVKPVDTTYSTFKWEEKGSQLQEIEIKHVINSADYTQTYFAMFFAFVVLVLAIISKKKYGFLTKSIYFSRKFKNVDKLKQEVVAIEEQPMVRQNK
ncbi:hypothetical protein [Mycoplasma hafezii]|uniref:hypothetical protein n=1 Tax=Mycoplasma hafezii TaxID=525886 RepID=UPI003CECA1DC